MPGPQSVALTDWLKARSVMAPAAIELDAVVIGSGYGGSVAALRLAEQGHRVVVLERGAEFLPGDFPNTAGQLPRFVRAHGLDGPVGGLHGLFDLRIGQGFTALVASGLGGGSLINAGVMMRPDADVFAQAAWPAELRHGLDTGPTRLDAAFERAAAGLGGESFHDPGAPPGPVSSLPKARAMVRLGAALARDRRLARQDRAGAGIDFTARPATVTLDLARCTRCGDCFTGCNVPGAKKTLPIGYLARACTAGAELVTRALVHALAPGVQGGWNLRVLPAERARDALRVADAAQLHGTTLHARVVVLAAGTFGSTELLLRSQQMAGTAFPLSPALGTRLSGNGDSLSALADLPEPVHGVGHGAATLGEPAPVGPTITTVLDLRTHPDLQRRLVIQEGAAPGALARAYQEILAGAWALQHLGTRWRAPRSTGRADPLSAGPALARHSQMLLTMGHDGSAGRIIWLPAMDGAVPYWPRPDAAATYGRQQQVFDAAARSIGGVHLHTPLWHALTRGVATLADPPVPEPVAMTVHPLGGCPMGDSFEQGVVDHAGRVWKAPHVRWEGLYVLDGAIVPTSLGCNPLWTITALAERAMACRAVLAPRLDGASPAVDADARPSIPPRDPLPQARDHRMPTRFDLTVSERLELARLPLRGALRRALGSDEAQADLQLDMRSADWARVWDEDPRHRLDDLRGTLRLVVPGEGGDNTPRRLAYRVTGGHVELFPWEPPWPVLGRLGRLERTARVALSWWLLRGRRDLAHDPGRLLRLRWQDALTPWHLAWQAAEVRHVRYDLHLALARQAGAEAPPATLRLAGIKDIGYAAGWGEIARHLWRRLGRPRHDPGERGPRTPVPPPAALRTPLLHQLTQPRLWLAESGSWAARLPWSRWPGWVAQGLHPGSRARFQFDLQQALSQVPARLHGGGDTVEALGVLLAYPALVARWLVLTRALEWRRPAESGRAVRDDASPDDVGLRLPWPAGSGHLLQPDEIVLHVRRGASSSDDGTEDPADLPLRLWRYRQVDPESLAPLPVAVNRNARWCGLPVRQARAVLLMHAFDMSGLAYTFKETERNFAEHLHAAGWEVWILDSRMSPRTRAVLEPCTVDQLGLIDAPAAIDHIVATLEVEHGHDPERPLQIHAFGQCMGAAALLIGLLSGRLVHADRPAPPEYAAAGHAPPLCPRLAGLVTSQTHPFVVGSRTAQSRTRIPALLRDLAGRTRVPLAVREPVMRLAETVADRLFAGMPVPEGEHCHGEGEVERLHDDDCATCRRVRFLLGGMYAHDQLNAATHAALPRLFGSGSVRLFAQGAKFFDHERLCSEDGFHIWATDEAIARHLALPLRFVHGERNDLFDAESARRSAAHYRRLHPGWVQRYGLPQSGPGSVREVCDVIEGHGHLDVLIGLHASRPGPDGRSPYDRLAALLETAWCEPEAAPLAVPDQGTAPLAVRAPRAGPFFGPVQHASDGQRRLGLAFVLDDGGALDRQGPDEAAVAVVWPRGRRAQARCMRLDVTALPATVPARDGHAGSGPVGAPPGLRVAHGQLAWEPGTIQSDLRVECLSLPGPADGVLPDAQGLLLALARLREDADRQRRTLDLPCPPTLSLRRRRPAPALAPRARLPAAVLAETGRPTAVQFAVGCCRSPGLGIDTPRADASLMALLARLLRGDVRPDALLLLGGQVYTQRPDGWPEPLSPVERFLHRHAQVFTAPGLRRVLARLPAVCLPDDHEFTDDYPEGRPLFRGPARQPTLARLREQVACETARQAVQAWQCMALPASLRNEGWFSFERGGPDGVRVFVLDTWLHRRRLLGGGVTDIVTEAARAAFTAWVEAGRGGTGLHLLVSASALVPARRPGADPASPRRDHTLHSQRGDERAWLLGRLAEAVPGRFLLVSGDHHLGTAGTLHPGDAAGPAVGGFVLAPPLHAPLQAANLAPHDLRLDERISLPSGNVLQVAAAGGWPAQAGSGHGILTCEPSAKGRWRVTLTAQLQDLAAGEAPRHLAWPPLLLGPVPGAQ